jgi:hypothetical protein
MGKHRDKMQQDLTLRGFSSTTCESYLRYAKAFVAHCMPRAMVITRFAAS